MTKAILNVQPKKMYYIQSNSLRTRENVIFQQIATPGLRKPGATWTSNPKISYPGLKEDCLVAQTCAYVVQLSLYKTIQITFFHPSELHTHQLPRVFLFFTARYNI